MTGQDRLLTRQEVQDRCRIGRASIYRLMRKSSFPKPIRVGDRAVRWLESEIEKYLSNRPRAEGELVRLTDEDS
ncbi:MAG: AlpA family phage regulatory protein [Gemmatimonadetes bacterium]|nr:AlpA family phage regulatory protein [Gemmatimonadota bacterium]MYB61907.1 AlpA family phage regulatory protein [Gemmatimonadota bacterium]